MALCYMQLPFKNNCQCIFSALKRNQKKEKKTEKETGSEAKKAKDGELGEIGSLLFSLLDADRNGSLTRGEVVEFGPPLQLLSKPGGAFPPPPVPHPTRPTRSGPRLAPSSTPAFGRSVSISIASIAYP